MPEQNDRSPTRLDRLVRQARWVLAFEGLWPPAVLAGVLVALFVALSWIGLWVAVPRPIRILGVFCLLFGLMVAGLAAVRKARPGRAEALRRLDRDSGRPHRPVSTIEDQLANAGQDPATGALWALHLKRLDADLARVRVASPAPRLAERDPMAFRALAVLLLVAAGFVAGPAKDGLVAAAFDWRGRGGPPAPGFRLDAWVDPPAYTGRPPVILFAGNGSGKPPEAVTVPVHSTVVIRSVGEGKLQVAADDGLKPADTPPPPSRASSTVPAPPKADETRLTLTRSARLSLDRDGIRIGSVDLQAVPDAPPTLSFVGSPKATARGALTLGYRIGDDYGVVGAEAGFSDPTRAGRPIAGRSLVPPPKLALTLPSGPGGLGTGQTTGDLSDHPWAGLDVTAVLSARDEGGNVGLSAPVHVKLPSRPFTNPLARAIVEQRQDLVLDPDHRALVDLALDALLIAPDRFGTSNGVYLGLYTAQQRLRAARNDDDLVQLADYLWQMALRIEDGDLSQTQRDLRAAEQALREALARGAPPEEIRKLTEALRQQMDKFLAEMARQQNRQEGRAADPNAKVVTPRDLQAMMKRMQEMAQSGNTAEAQRMLDALQNLLDNLRTARNGAGDQAMRELNRQMGELDRMTKDQQGVRDRTFKQGRQDRHAQPQPFGPSPDGDDGDDPDDQAGPNAAPPPSGDEASEQELQQQQQVLRQRLEAMQKKLRDLGAKGEQGLDDAEQAMKDAEGALSQGPPGNRRAVDAQGRALQGLQKGANGLAQQMAEGQGQGAGQQQGEGEGDGQQGGTGQDGQGMATGSDTDPLGRRRDGRGTLETRGAEIGESVAARAQRVLEELRRRLGDPTRPQQEQDYLERLLKHY